MAKRMEYMSIQPEYVRRFTCDGAACGSLCCGGWGVMLASGEYEKYRRIRPKSLRQKILSQLHFNEILGAYEFFPAGGRCSLLREDGLCSLQLTCGEDALTDVCAEYPRKTYIFPGAIERALCMTCPVAARLALSDENPMKLEAVNISTDRERYFQRADNSEAVISTGFLDLQAAGISILQRRELTLDERLALLGDFFSRADRLVEEGLADEVAVLGKSFVTADAHFLAGRGHPQSLHRVYKADARSLAGRGASFEKYFPSMLDFARNIRELTEDDEADTAMYIERAVRVSGEKEKAREALFRYREDVLSRFGYMLENYLVNEFFIGLYPCALPGSFVRNFKVFTMLFKEMEFFLIAENHERPSEAEDILRMVRWISIRTNHFAGYVEKVARCVDTRDKTPDEFFASTLVNTRPA